MYVVDCLCVNVSRGLKPVARPFPGFSDLLLLFRKMSGTQECKLVAAIMGKIEHEAHEYERRIEDLHKLDDFSKTIGICHANINKIEQLHSMSGVSSSLQYANNEMMYTSD